MALTQIQQDGLSANALAAITASVLAPGAVAGNVLSANAFADIASNVRNTITAGTGITVSSATVNGANVLVINSAVTSAGFNPFLLAGM
jgi:hypothetical protein